MVNVRIEPGWKNALSEEWGKPYFAELVEFVRSEYASETIFPPAGRIFAAFDACPFDKTRVVILGQDPYHDTGQANGLCFSVAQGVQPPPSLVNIFKEVNADTAFGRSDTLGRTRRPAFELSTDCESPSSGFTSGTWMGDIYRCSDCKTCKSTVRFGFYALGQLCDKKRCFHRPKQTPCAYLASSIASVSLQRLFR